MARRISDATPYFTKKRDYPLADGNSQHWKNMAQAVPEDYYEAAEEAGLEFESAKALWKTHFPADEKINDLSWNELFELGMSAMGTVELCAQDRDHADDMQLQQELRGA